MGTDLQANTYMGLLIMRKHSFRILNYQNKCLRRGTITVLAAVFSVVILGMVALSVDLGYILSMKEELQRTADASALAACWDYGRGLANGHDTTVCDQSARAAAQDCAEYNEVGNQGPDIDPNTSNNAEGDLVLGYVSDLYDPNAQFDTNSVDAFNAVKVRIRRDENYNGNVPSFFARIFGHTGQPIYAEATAAIIRDVKGFQTPHNGSNIDLLPFALDLDTWNDWMGRFKLRDGRRLDLGSGNQAD